MEKNERVLVTGATGLLGSHLLYRLLECGLRPLALKRKSSCLEAVHRVFRYYPDGEELWPLVEWIEGDVLEPDTLRPYMDRITLLFHCAAVVSFAAGEEDVLERTNLKGTENVAALCLEAGVRCCYVSSIAALGDARTEGEEVDEDTPVIAGREHSVYSRSKGRAEAVVWRYIARGLDAVLVCPSVILGAGHWNRSSARLYLAASRGIPVYTRGGSGYVDVRDVASLMVRLGTDRAVRGRRFVLNGGNHFFRELFTVIARRNGRRPPFIRMTPFLTSIAWRCCGLAARLKGRTPDFTRETARISHARSCYSSARIAALYPDFRFHTLEETVEEIYRARRLEEN